ncbi:hypothetical protein B0H13DRAFT_930069 [Mycena leptocephala]|nr:hypothetical protein B0H13DRAFT_930069 [Mycena leptocephala]
MAMLFTPVAQSPALTAALTRNRDGNNQRSMVGVQISIPVLELQRLAPRGLESFLLFLLCFSPAWCSGTPFWFFPPLFWSRPHRPRAQGRRHPPNPALFFLAVLPGWIPAWKPVLRKLPPPIVAPCKITSRIAALISG